MNYVGQLAGQVFVTVKELYRGLNPATLSGCIDVIVVRQPDGSLLCSPFHVRFGKLGVLRSREKVVDIEINGRPVNLHMKLGDNGEAFFVEETQMQENMVPARLVTSPIPCSDRDEGEDDSDDMEMEPILGDEDDEDIGKVRDLPELLAGEAASCASVPVPLLSPPSASKKRRKRRRKSKMDTTGGRRESATTASHDGEIFAMEMNSDEEAAATSPGLRNSSFQVNSGMEAAFFSGVPVHPHSDGDWSPLQSPSSLRPMSPKSDSELVSKGSENDLLRNMQWSWGQLPERAQLMSLDMEDDEPLVVDIIAPRDTTHFRVIFEPPNSSGDTDDDIFAPPPPRAEPPAFRPASSPDDDDDDDDDREEDDGGGGGGDYGRGGGGGATSGGEAEGDASCWNVLCSSPPPQLTSRPTVRPEMLLKPKASPPGRRECGDGRPEEPATAQPGGRTAESEAGFMALSDPAGSVGPDVAPGEHPELAVPLQLESMDANETKALSKAESPVRKKEVGKRSQYLGQSDIYLDELSRLDPVEAAMYFPKSEGEPCPPGRAGEVAAVPARSPSHSPQSVGSGAADSGTECLSDSAQGDASTVALSLCGGLAESCNISQEKFEAHRVSFQQFLENPALIDDLNLVVLIGNKYYNWAVAAPMLLSMQAFHKPLPKLAVEALMKEKMPKKSNRWWFSWRRRDNSAKAEGKREQLQPDSGLSGEQSGQSDTGIRLQDDESSSSSEDEELGPVPRAVPLLEREPHVIAFRKSLRLSSEQIAQLQLKEGPNTVSFSVTTQYQGTCRCEGTIYLWNWNDKIIISDIDGTITKSDALGQILPTLGKDWTQQGIAKLYHEIHKNGYKFLYCSARAIGMAGMTRGYLNWVKEKGTELPRGPLLLAPSSLLLAFHREVIEKKPEKFKIQCLADIKHLFSPHSEPFYAAFGNKTNDVFAYKQVGVSENHIFTVNPKGELIQEHSKGHKSSYTRLGELVEHVFPLHHRESTSAFPCAERYSDFTFWREPIHDCLPECPPPEEP
ncbi:phosphatidate phosphatase LPIN2-like isoform X1 [Petromyzon marinus]|uniref:phosphatidate phosphatase LPIN2-like isoform X1 n=1 Tax=Petromyzon marinus TaxID=7757 RepID=UPI003F6FB7CD